MTLDQALQTLEVVMSAPPEEVRRAYLRKLKSHKPETDPDGFQRLRNAYDVVKSLQAAAMPIEAMSADVAGDQAVVAEALPAVDELSAELPAPSEPEKTPLQRMREQVANGEEAALWPLATTLLLSGEVREGAPVLVRAFECVDSAPPGAVPPPGAMLELLLLLNEHGQSTEASQCAKSLAAWMERQSLELVFTRQQLSSTWALVRELSLLPVRFPAEIRAALARGIRAGDAHVAVPDLRAFAESQPAVAEQAIYQLADHAPLLQGLFAFYLNTDAPLDPAAHEQQRRGELPPAGNERWNLLSQVPWSLLALAGLLATNFLRDCN